MPEIADRPTEASLSPEAYCRQIVDLLNWVPVRFRRELREQYPTTLTVVQLWQAGLVDPRRTPEMLARLADLHRATAKLVDRLANHK